jgi:hypothetical protein
MDDQETRRKWISAEIRESVWRALIATSNQTGIHPSDIVELALIAFVNEQSNKENSHA